MGEADVETKWQEGDFHAKISETDREILGVMALKLGLSEAEKVLERKKVRDKASRWQCDISEITV